MSTPSSNGPNGQRQRPPTANPRPKPTPNPLRPIKRRPAKPLAVSKSAPLSRPADPTVGNSQLGLKMDGEAGAAAKLERLRSQYGGWSEPPPSSGYRDIPIVTTAKALREGSRYHVMRFPQPTGLGDRGAIDPTDQTSFTRPVLLHRRDPRQPPPGYVSKRQKKEETPEEETADDKEAERLEQVKAEREAQKAADQAKIAPTVKEMISKRPRKPKDDQVVANRMPKTEKGRKEASLRYEEALPWHLEDVDGKNVLAGRYVAALSEANVALIFDGSKYRMIPLEKWYRFTHKPPYQSDGEDDETGDKKKKKEAPLAGWMTRTLKKREEESESKNEFRNSGKRLGPARAPAYANDVRGDEIDMEGDEFDDDDENTGFDHDEDTKISNERIRREQLGANLFGDADEKEVDAEEERKLRRELERKMASRKLKKTLKKRENVDDVESDESASSDDPFAESSSDDEEDEEEDESQAKTEEDEKTKGEKDKSAPGTGQKGSTTPSGRKQADVAKKVKNLKRPGSPTHSESSGNESVLRKKAKKKAGSTAGPSRSTTPLPQGQGVPSQAGQRRKMAGGSGSDGEATGGEMSDGQPKKKKIKLIPSSSKGTPAGSRAGSPLPAPASGSPGASPTKDGQGAASPKPAIEAWEIVQALPQLPDGISIQNFLKLFEGRVGEKAEGGRMAKSEWIKMVRENCNYGSDKLLRRKS